MILSRSLTTKKKSEILLFAAVAGVCTQIAIAVSDENGDISITPDLFEAPVNSSSKRDTSETGPRLWPSRTAIPYYISSDFEKSQREVILKALLKIERMTKGCIAFKVRQYEFDYIYFIPSYSGRCSSDVGRTGGYQYIYLAVATIDYPYLCLDTAAIQTRVLHALGFDHEQKRADRDQFVDVRSDNIKSGFAHEYQINASVHTLGTKYDYHSITHYGPFSGAIVDSSPVMVSKKGLIVRMGQRQRLSPTDVAKIMLAYNCPVNTGPGHKSSNTTEEFPRYPLEIMTEDECAAQFNRYCKSDVSTTVNCTYRNDFRIVCQSNSSVAVLQRMTVDMAEAPLRIVSIDVEEQLIAKYPFLPVQQQVLKLQLRNCTTNRVTNRLNSLGFKFLLHFELYHCYNLVIAKADFTTSQHLRIVVFCNTTVASMQPNTFADLPNLSILSLEALSESQRYDKFEQPFRTFLRSLHCDCQFAWYRSWWRSSKQLRLKVDLGELYSFDAFYLNQQFNSDAFVKEQLYHPVDCQADPFPLGTEWINYYTQADYSVNQPNCSGYSSNISWPTGEMFKLA